MMLDKRTRLLPVVFSGAGQGLLFATPFALGLAAAAFFALRAAGRWAENDTAVLASATAAVVRTQELVPADGTVYPHGYVYQALSAFLLALTVGTGLLVRQFYHGAFLTGAALPNEAYGYSLAFLIVSIGLILAGVRLPDKALRLAGLVLLTATIVKVFLVDAAARDRAIRRRAEIRLRSGSVPAAHRHSARKRPD